MNRGVVFYEEKFNDTDYFGTGSCELGFDGDYDVCYGSADAGGK